MINSYGFESRGIDLKIHVDDIFLRVDATIPRSGIYNELESNSLKHAFPGDRAGEILVNFREVDGQYTMLFKDNDMKIPEDVDVDRPSSLGLIIVNALTCKIGAKTGTVRNGGHEISITFSTSSTNGNKHKTSA